MKFLQKILHLTLIVSIFLAPMDLSWAMEEGEEVFVYKAYKPPKPRIPPANKEQKEEQKEEQKKKGLSDDERNFFGGGEEDVRDDSDDEAPAKKQADILQLTLNKLEISELLKDVITEEFNQTLFQELNKPKNSSHRESSDLLKKLQNALAETGITDQKTVLVYVSRNTQPPPAVSNDEFNEVIPSNLYLGASDQDVSTDINLFFNTLDQEFWLKHLPTTWKTRVVQIIPDFLGFGPPHSLTAIIMFEVGYFFNFQNLNPAAYTMIAWLTTTLSPPLVRQFHERARIISGAIFGEEAFKPTGKSDSKPHVYNHNWLHKLAKGGIVVGSFFNGLVYLGFFVWDVEDTPTDAGDIIFTVLTGVPLFLSFWDLFYSNASVALDREFRKYWYEESSIVGFYRNILLEKISEVRCAINHPKANKFITSLFNLIVIKLNVLKGATSILEEVPHSLDRVIAVTALLFKRSHRVFVPTEDAAEEESSSPTPLNELLGEAAEAQKFLAKAKNFREDLMETRHSSWWHRGLGFLGELVPGIRIYTQYIIFKHLWEIIGGVIARTLGLDDSFVNPMGYVVSAAVTGMRTIAEKTVIKKWFQSLPSLFSFNQDIIELRKPGRVTSLINAILLGLVEGVIADFAYPDLNLLSKIILFASNTIGTTAVFDTFLSEKTDHLITGAFTLDCLQKVKSHRVRRVFINYWLDQLKKVFEELDGESIKVIYRRTQDAA